MRIKEKKRIIIASEKKNRREGCSSPRIERKGSHCMIVIESLHCGKCYTVNREKCCRSRTKAM